MNAEKPSPSPAAAQANPAVRFHTSLLATGKNTTGIAVPPEIIEQLGDGKRPPVRVTIGSYTYRTTVGVMGGKTLVPVSADHRKQAGIMAGDDIDVQLELDTQAGDVKLPADFAEALSQDPRARSFFDALSPSQKRWHLQQVESARTNETRQRRISKSVELLHQQRAR
jgi:hypothetical protein